jgi:hypothetical protein
MPAGRVIVHDEVLGPNLTLPDPGPVESLAGPHLCQPLDRAAGLGLCE